MVLYTCERCKKTFTQKSNYEAHQNKKFLCTQKSTILHEIPQKIVEKNQVIEKEVVKKYECSYCHKILSRSDSLLRHIGTCKIKKQHENNLEEICAQLVKERDENKKAFDELKKEVEQLKTKQSMTQKIGTQQNIAQQNNFTNIKLVAFGKEDISMISDVVFKYVINRCFGSVPELVERIHFDKKIPENHNVFISNIRSDNAIVFNGESWNLEDRDEILSQLYEDCVDYLEEKFEKLSGQLSDSSREHFQKFIELRDNVETKKRRMKSIRELLYNKRHIIIQTKKQIETQQISQ
jgi:hypothetical protein